MKTNNFNFNRMYYNNNSQARIKNGFMSKPYLNYKYFYSVFLELEEYIKPHSYCNSWFVCYWGYSSNATICSCVSATSCERGSGAPLSASAAVGVAGCAARMTSAVWDGRRAVRGHKAWRLIQFLICCRVAGL